MTAIDSTRLLAMRTAILEQNSALQRAAGAGGPGGIAGNADAKGAAGFGDALQSALAEVNALQAQSSAATTAYEKGETTDRSEEHTSELQSLMRISYAVFCLKKKRNTNKANMYKTHIKHHKQ